MLPIEDRRADGDGRQDVNPVHPEVAIRADMAGAAVVKLNQIPRVVFSRLKSQTW